MDWISNGREGVTSDWEVESFEVANETTRHDDDGDNDDNRNFTDGRDVVTTMDDTTLTASAGEETADSNRQLVVPNAIHRLHHPMARRDGVVCLTENVVDDVDNASDADGTVGLMEEDEPLALKTVGGITCVRMLSLDFFRSKLVTHFDIAYKRNEVKWPQRMKSRRPATNL
ncbi:hypothetical protein MHU86_5912 [Fragilaria crotonensis]|nr:hypothetical protein MHU86_5912 [Fragilaria crotonensis]